MQQDEESSDDEEPDDIELLDSLTRDAEQHAAKLVQLLVPTSINMEEIGDILRSMGISKSYNCDDLGKISKEFHETAGDSLSREQAKKLMETTQSMLLVALEMKKDPQMDSPTKRKDLLEAVKNLLNVMKDIQVDAEINQMLQ